VGASGARDWHTQANCNTLQHTATHRAFLSTTGASIFTWDITIRMTSTPCSNLGKVERSLCLCVYLYVHARVCYVTHGGGVDGFLAGSAILVVCVYVYIYNIHKYHIHLQTSLCTSVFDRLRNTCAYV